MQYKLSELVNGLDVVIKGDPNSIVTGVSTIQHAEPGQLTFLTNALYRKHLAATKASVVVLTEDDAIDCPMTAVITPNPHYTYAKIATFFDPTLMPAAGIHPTAVIGKDCRIDAAASIGPHVVIGNQVNIAAGVVIGPGSIIGDFVEIGADTRLDAHATICHHVVIGKRVRIASGAVIGSDGFGFANQKGVWHKVPQLGSVQIGDDVDIGANTTIDRGAIEDTVIEEGVKLDNLIQIGHNVRIGAHTVIAGCTGVAGSTTIGKFCMIGGACSIAGHITIADKVILTGGTGVSKSITDSGMYSSGVVGALTNMEWRKANARFYRLESLMQRVKQLESALNELKESKSS